MKKYPFEIGKIWYSLPKSLTRAFWTISHPKTPPGRTILKSNFSKNSNLKSLLITLTQEVIFIVLKIILTKTPKNYYLLYKTTGLEFGKSDLQYSYESYDLLKSKVTDFRHFSLKGYNCIERGDNSLAFCSRGFF